MGMSTLAFGCRIISQKFGSDAFWAQACCKANHGGCVNLLALFRPLTRIIKASDDRPQRLSTDTVQCSSPWPGQCVFTTDLLASNWAMDVSNWTRSVGGVEDSHPLLCIIPQHKSVKDTVFKCCPTFPSRPCGLSNPIARNSANNSRMTIRHSGFEKRRKAAQRVALRAPHTQFLRQPIAHWRRLCVHRPRSSTSMCVCTRSLSA